MKNLVRKTAVAIAIACLFALACFVCACGTPNDDGDGNTAFTITYSTGENATTVDSLTVEAGSKIYPPAEPSRDGYRFDCWTLDGETYVFDVMPKKDITLVAAWKKIHTVTFDTGDGGTVIDELELVEGDEITVTETPERAGYKFGGWKNNGEAFTDMVMPDGNVMLTAVWIKAYTITFNTGTPDFTIKPIVEVAGEKITAPDVNRPGWHITGWREGNSKYEFNTMPERDVTITVDWVQLTNLPSMFVDLFDANGNKFYLNDVTRETYVQSSITITNTDDEYCMSDVKSQFRGRGNGSWWDSGDKKGYKIKFDKKQSLFGREKNKHWVVIACANFNDITMSRNYLAYNMAGELFSNIEYATEARWIDLYVNNEYRGVYLLCEHVRVGAGRVDIDSQYGVEDTGFLVEYDAYATGEEGVDYFRINGVKHGFTVKSPDPEDYAVEGNISKADYMKQVAYIKDYVSQVYQAALGRNYEAFAALADVDSFIDMYILHELFKNVDTGYSSFYLYKKPGGKLYAGPPWDFDATTNFDASFNRGDRSPQGIFVAGAVMDDNSHCASELYIALYQTAGFKSAVKARWKQLSPQIKSFLDERLNDEVYNTYKAAMGKNFAKWHNKSQQNAENDWVRDVKALKQWLTDRITWLDNEWK